MATVESEPGIYRHEFPVAENWAYLNHAAVAPIWVMVESMFFERVRPP